MFEQKCAVRFVDIMTKLVADDLYVGHENHKIYVIKFVWFPDGSFAQRIWNSYNIFKTILMIDVCLFVLQIVKLSSIIVFKIYN